MSRSKAGMLTAAIRALFNGNPQIETIPGFPNGPANTVNAPDIPNSWAYGNGAEVRYANSAGDDEVRALSVNSDDRVTLAETLAPYNRKFARFQVADTASLVSQGFWLCPPDESYRIVSASFVAGTKASVATLVHLEKTPDGTAVGSGTAVTETLDVNGVTNATPAAFTLAGEDSDDPDLILTEGDMLSIIIPATHTALANVHVTVVLAPLGPSRRHITFFANANAALVQKQAIFVLPRQTNVRSVSIRYGTKSSVSGLKLTVTDDPSGTAVGGGTSLLTDNTNAGILVTQDANTMYSGTLSATPLNVLNGHSLALCFSGATLTALVGLVVTISCDETAADETDLTFFLDHVVGQSTLTGIAALSMFIADRTYEVADLGEVHRVAGDDSGAVTIGIGFAAAGTAAGSATLFQTDTSNAGFSIKSTAATPLFGTLVARNARMILAGQRICTVPAGTFATAAGTVLTVTLRPR